MKHIFIFILSLIGLYTHSQIKMEGIIVDSLNAPLESASIVAINKLTNGLENYALSNQKGKYELNLKENTGYKIQVS